MIKVEIQGMQALQAHLAGLGKQVRYAASRALNNVAFAANTELKTEMQRVFKGGATPYTLRAFRVEKAARDNLTAVVRLRDDAPSGGTSYTKALRHIFTSGTRQWKKDRETSGARLWFYERPEDDDSTPPASAAGSSAEVPDVPF